MHLCLMGVRIQDIPRMGKKQLAIISALIQDLMGIFYLKWEEYVELV